MKASAERLNHQFAHSDPEEILAYFLEKFPEQVIFSTGLGAEDQVITHMICNLGRPVRFFTLDTGRLFQETYDLLQVTEARYGIKIDVLFPDWKKVEKMVGKKGINLFYESVENRQRCCQIRKTDQLKRALKGNAVWIAGLRREQSLNRRQTQRVEWDDKYQLYKVNPLAEWTHGMVWDFIRKHHIPYNKLHDKGFASIGCQPCTRTVEPGEDLRAGRWWWEMDGHKECGIHI
jgi:phosphoadenosine phosphosulfate reductase